MFRKRLVRLAGWSAVTVVALAITLAIVVSSRWKRTFDAPYPNIQASSDPKVIERGRYLAYGPAHCVNCHTSNDQEEEVKGGATPPLTGGYKFVLPFGTLYSRNLTPDRETGIGRYTDGELARVLRHGVLPSGRTAMPLMEMQNLSNEDLRALISFLRSQEPVRNRVPDHEFNFLGKAILAFLMKPVGPSMPVRENNPPEGTLESGEYLATSVANCASCHTKRNLMTGEFITARFSGGMEFGVDDESVLVTPNLTPHASGRIFDWDEERFVGRFGAGVGLQGTHMPWRQYQTMSEADVRAIYRYLRTLQPVDHATGPSLQLRKKKA